MREPDGNLRTSSWEEKDRVNQIYFPKEGRRHYTPQMFEPEQLESVMGPEKYEYILDRSVQRSCTTILSRPLLGTVSSLSLITPPTSGPVRLSSVISPSTNTLTGFIPQSESLLVSETPISQS